MGTEGAFILFEATPPAGIIQFYPAPKSQNPLSDTPSPLQEGHHQRGEWGVHER